MAVLTERERMMVTSVTFRGSQKNFLICGHDVGVYCDTQDPMPVDDA